MIYDYKCDACGHIFERTSRMSDREVPLSEPCPECKKENVVQRYMGNQTMGWSDAIQLGMKKSPEEWRSFLRTLHKNTPGSMIDADRK